MNWSATKDGSIFACNISRPYYFIEIRIVPLHLLLNSCQFLSWTTFKNFLKSFHTLLMTFWTFEYLCLNFLTNVISWLSNCYERHFVFCNHKCSPMKLRIEFWVFQHDYIAPFFSFLNRTHNGWEKVRQSCHLIFPSHFL